MAVADRRDLPSSRVAILGCRMRRRYGSPKAEFATLALGKLGGDELNHSSDVDLLFLYSEEGQLTPHLSYHQFFNRLETKFSKHFRHRIRPARFFESTSGCAPKAQQARWLDLSKAWKTITPGLVKRGNGLRSSKRAASPAAESWLTISCDCISRLIDPRSATPDLLDRSETSSTASNAM